MARQPEHLTARIQCHFVAHERVRAVAGLVYAKYQPGVFTFAAGKHQIHANRPIQEGVLFADQLGPIVSVDCDRTIAHDPSASKGFKSINGRSRRRLLKAFTINHLAVKPAVYFMVYIFDACTGQ